MEARTAQRRPPPPSRPDRATEEAALAALILVLLSGLPPAAMVGFAVTALEPLGIPTEAIRRALGLLHPHLEPPDAAAVGALGWVEQTSAARQAAYIVNAAQRLGESPEAVAKERHHLRQHLAAERGRRDSARRVDRMATRYGPVLGWYAISDESTTHECRAADGRNFTALPPPAIGLPGAVHPFCRCLPGPPHPGAELIR